MAGKSLSKASPYEQLFKTRYRPVGRPADAEESPLSARGREIDPAILKAARRRAQAVVYEENRDRLAEVFEAELRVLNRRGPEEVAEDIGYRPRVLEAAG